jgi:DNA repair exonuclease SbcCD nuclease subunit
MPARQALRRRSLRASFDAAVGYAIEHGARFFIQAGDLFDTPTPGNEDRAFVADALARLRRADVIPIGIGGNHDAPRPVAGQRGEAPQGTYAALDGLYYFPHHDILRPRLFTVGTLKLAIAGLSHHPLGEPGGDPLASIPIEDPEGALAQADAALLVVHAGIEGLCRPSEGERLVTRAGIAALPLIFRIIVAGHMHQFGHARIDGRDIVVCGSTERMEFGAEDGGSGFAWVQITRDGIWKREHIQVPEQPRVDLTISTGEIWPGSPLSREAGSQPSPAELILQRLAGVITPETMVRLRLVGPLTPEQYHQLVTRDLLVYGRRNAFSFDLDTRNLRLIREDRAQVGAAAGAGPISVVHEVEAVLGERLAGISGREITDRVEDERAAAELLTDRLRASRDWEAGQ